MKTNNSIFVYYGSDLDLVCGGGLMMQGGQGERERETLTLSRQEKELAFVV